MKLQLTIILSILIQINLSGIERYTKGDILFNWASKLNLREEPGLEGENYHSNCEGRAGHCQWI